MRRREFIMRLCGDPPVLRALGGAESSSRSSPDEGAPSLRFPCAPAHEPPTKGIGGLAPQAYARAGRPSRVRGIDVV